MKTEILKVTVGEPTLLSHAVYQNNATIAVSRAGTVAAFYPKPDGVMYYRISDDGGCTWGGERGDPPAGVGSMSIGRREGGVLTMLGMTPVEGGQPDELEARRTLFADDFLTWEEGTSTVSLPDVVMHTRWANFWPVFATGKIVELDNGDLLGTTYGNLRGDDNWYRTMVLRSRDGGDSWRFHATVAFSPDDPHPQWPGSFCGYCEPSLALLPNGKLLCIMRTQGAQFAGEYRPLYQCWSDDLGKTWTEPVPSQPHLMNIAPTLAVLENGVVACRYGRPGFHVAFSLDDGHTWQDRIRFSDLPEPVITGQFDMVRVAANRLVAIGNDGEGTKVWPIDVERVAISQRQFTVRGRVVDERGRPIAHARVERGPIRYYLDSWLEHATDLDPWDATPLTIGSPELSYRSIRSENAHPTVQTDARGEFRFDAVELGEYVLTVEADGFAPQCRDVTARPECPAHAFQLKSGRALRGQVVDDAGQSVAGACVVLNQWHLHSDDGGYCDWAVEGHVPEQVEFRACKRYDGRYEEVRGCKTLAALESEAILLGRASVEASSRS